MQLKAIRQAAADYVLIRYIMCIVRRNKLCYLNVYRNTGMLLYLLKSQASVFGAWNMDVCFLNSTNGYYVALILISFS